VFKGDRKNVGIVGKGEIREDLEIVKEASIDVDGDL
jgi:hypothetical protein